MLQDRRYLLALDFTEKFTDRNQRFLAYTEPYYMPRPNHLEGHDWMKRVLCFNLTSIVNGGLQKTGMTLTSNCEYLPTLRIMASGYEEGLSSSPAIRFALKKSELLAVSLKSEVPNNKGTLAREFVLARKYEMKRNTFSKEDLVPTSGPPRNQHPRPAQGHPNPLPAGVRNGFPRTESGLRPSHDPGLTKGVLGVTSNAHSVLDPPVRFPSMRRPPQNSILGATYTPPHVRPGMAAPLRSPVCPQQMHLTPRPGGQFDQCSTRQEMSSRCKGNVSQVRVPTSSALVFPSECLLPGPPSVPPCRARLASPLWVNCDLPPSSHAAFADLY
ncbi:uncharacterized protein ISCGN_026583 [Ixodes scapularis]